MKCKIRIIIGIVFVFLFIIASIKVSSVNAATTTNVDSTVKISVCGNDIAEGGEECDGPDLRGKSCISEGFGGGALYCDIGCNLDTSICVAATPTPTPSITPTPLITIEPTGVQNTNSEPTSAPPIPPITEIPTDVKDSIVDLILSQISNFPKALVYFGANSEGKIEITNLRNSVSLWVAQWQKSLTELTVKDGEITGQESTKKCDINGDNICNLVDLSVMLYHVE